MSGLCKTAGMLIRPLDIVQPANVTFSLSNDSYVALKISTSHCLGAEHETLGLDILKEISYQQPQARGGERETHVMGFSDHFQVEGLDQAHECIETPVLGGTLDRQADKFADRCIPVCVVKEITKQLLTGLQFLHEKCDVVHTGIAAAVRLKR